MLKREAFVLRTSKDGKRAICIDDGNAEDILEYINRDPRHRKKFRFVVDIILGGMKNRELYDKEVLNKSSSKVTAMKFFKGQENDRIYCVEKRIDNKLYVVICSELYEKKKTKKADKRVRQIINRISKYEYEIIKDK